MSSAEYQKQWRARHGARTGVFGPHITRDCGTVAAYQRHLRHGETPCDACKRAQAERIRNYRQRSRSK